MAGQAVLFEAEMIWSHCGRTLLTLSLFGLSGFGYSQTLQSITFDGDTRLYLSIREFADALELPFKQVGSQLMIGDVEIRVERRLFDGTSLMTVRSLAHLGLDIEWIPAEQVAEVRGEGVVVRILKSPKKVMVDLDKQRLFAYEGEKLVFETNVSTGRPGHRTPTGSFTAGPAKHVRHYSRLYSHSPMPWAVQVNRNVFIHGYKDVPSYPASHGCIRVPLTGGNPARWFFEWVERGTPIDILHGGDRT